MPYKNIEDRRASQRRYEKTHKELRKKYRNSHKEKSKNNSRLEYHKIYRQNIKRIVLNHYSNNTMKCSNCGEDDFQALTIDHINNDGAEHREKITQTIYHWLINQNFPEGFQVLCMNCNSIKHWFGTIEYRKNKYSPVG